MQTQWRHKKTGGLYTVLMHATLEADLREAVVYRGEDGRVWVRVASEFYDGRFEPVSEGTAPIQSSRS